MEDDLEKIELIRLRIKNFYFVAVTAGLAAHAFAFFSKFVPALAIPSIALGGFIIYYFIRLFSTPCPNCIKPFFGLANFWCYGVLKKAKCKSCKFIVQPKST